MHDTATDPSAEYLKVNVTGTKQLARAAVEARVKRFIFLSTVKVNGKENVRPYREIDPPAPLDYYAISKLQAEQLLKKIATASGMELIILRPPLVYGPGVKANFLQLLKIVNKRLPIPLAGVHNRRSFIYLGNLVDAILTCLKRSNSAIDTYLVSDDHDVSTPNLIRMIAAALHKPSHLFHFPQLLLYTLAKLTGRGPAVDRLIGSLTVDISKIKKELDWSPPFTMEHGLQQTADWFNRNV